jgi:hypothetical protein
LTGALLLLGLHAPPAPIPGTQVTFAVNSIGYPSIELVDFRLLGGINFPGGTLTQLVDLKSFTFIG